jgi:putative transposase
MAWKAITKQEQRYELVREMGVGALTITELCRQLKISRQTAYKWRERFRSGRWRALADRSRRPEKVPGQTSILWLGRLRRLRKAKPSWGARKLQHNLGKQFGREGLPAIASCSRWLKRWGEADGQPRKLAGPVVRVAALRRPKRSNEVWTVDFKGWYRTGDGTRVDPLTVRDLYSRYGLRIALLRGQGVAAARREFLKIFRKYGLPERIRSDNGTPFGGGGPTRLTRLSAWWVKLGIQVEFITPGRPCENGAHEQFHRVYKAEVARQPAYRRAGQQRRGNRWLEDYNKERPHEGLAMGVPAERYRKSGRRLPGRLRPWKYPKGWARRWVKGSGEISWQGKRRYVGEAFVKDYIGLKGSGQGRWRVYFGPLLVGELYDAERGNIRPVKYQKRKRR